MSINNNIWELAEAWLSGTLPESEAGVLNSRLASDAEFAQEFNETANLIRSMEDGGRQKRFRSLLRDIHEAQEAAKPAGKARLIQLPPHLWRTAAVAASVAILTSMITYSLLTPSIKATQSQYNIIRRQVDNIKESQNQLKKSQNELEKDLKKINTPPPAPVRYTGTGFALSNNGYFVTSYHVVSGADSEYIQDHNGEYFKAAIYAYDENADLAVMKVVKKNFHFGKGDVPYTFAGGKSELGSRIFTLGYPKDQLLYGEGYVSARNGYDGYDNQFTLVLPAGHGQSGSPVIDENGNIMGILTAISGEGESNTYAVSSKALVELLRRKLPDNNVRLPKTNKLSRMSREDRIAKMEPYIFSVKVYKK